ncbi:iron-siderophore ABC transporter substrate-binding protein [Streptomyces sp. NPDC004610]|uniref:iron-siderophore ABC transporter substrate-binding protein n=1 Tax=unclassified Streptomyces TaxID=2593676 RepID=UPI0033A43151
MSANTTSRTTRGATLPGTRDPRPRTRIRPRHALRALTGTLLLALLGTACSSSSDDNGENTASASPSSSSAEAFPAEVATKFGTVTVDSRPQRVVALGWGDAETALALGVQPVGQSDWLAFGGDGVGPWAEDRYDESPEKIGTLEPEYERIAALDPDLILDVKSSGDQTRYDTLSQIAPTIGVPEGGDQYQITWQEQTTMIATALGLGAEGEQLISETEGAAAAAAEENPEFDGRSVTIGSRTSSGWGAYVRGTGRVDFMESLGFTNNPEVQAEAGTAFSVSVSEENLEMLDADLVVMAPIGVEATEISTDPLFMSLPAVEAGRSVVFDDQDVSQAFATNSVLSVGYALENVVPLFAEALR